MFVDEFIVIFLRYFQLLSNQSADVGELAPPLEPYQSACNCVVGYQVVFEVRPSDQSLFCVSVQIVEAKALLGTVPNSTKQIAILEKSFLKRKNPPAADIAF